MGEHRKPVPFELIEERLRGRGVRSGGCLLWDGEPDQPGGYGRVEVKGVSYRVHRLAWELANHKHLEPDELINHKCGVRMCFESEHLEVSGCARNQQYRTALHSSNTSGYRNVCWYKPGGKWRVALRLNGRDISGGYFDDIEEANARAIALRIEHYGVDSIPEVERLMAA